MTKNPRESLQTECLAWLDTAFTERLIDYWVFGGWAVDFHSGRVTRSHADIDVAIWLADLTRVVSLLEANGWAPGAQTAEDGYLTFDRGALSLDLAFLACDDTAGSTRRRPRERAPGLRGPSAMPRAR